MNLKFNWPTKKLGSLFTKIFESVERDSLERVKEGYRREEDHITTTVFTLLEERINNSEFEGLRVDTKQFQGRGPLSEESVTGADGALILDVSLKDISFRKFYLFQAKNFYDGRRYRLDEKSVEQKYKMLAGSSNSFFLIYSKRGFYFISAFFVNSKEKIEKLPSKSFVDFHKDFFDCFIGDHQDISRFFPLAKNNLLIYISEISEGDFSWIPGQQKN